MKKAIFLDRDGVLIEQIYWDGRYRAARTISECHILPEVEYALPRLKEAGYLLICLTNQPDVATGKIDKNNMLAIHKYLREALPLDDIIACCHSERDNCECRKPKIGMFLEAAKRHKIDLKQSWMIGDRPSDIVAGNTAGCKSILIGRVIRNLEEAANRVLAG